MATVVTPGNLGPEFEIGTNVANAITVRVDNVGVVRNAVTGELSSPPGVMSYVPGTQILTYTDGQGNVQNVDLSALTTDIYVDGATFNATNQILTLTDSDGTTPDVTVDLSTLLGVSADANNVLVNGTDGKPFFDSSTLTACTDAFGVEIFRAFPI